MSFAASARDAALLRRLRTPGPTLGVELRPPPSDLSREESMEAWIDLHHAVGRLAGDDRFVFLTDDAIGTPEEENLAHLTANLGGTVEFSRLVPFLTCKHPLEYCLLYAERAAARGLEALTVVGGDPSVGPPRCLPRSHMLRERIRERVPDLALGGWINPHRDPEGQAELLSRPEFEADYFLTQVVSHHDVEVVERFLEAAERHGVELPGAFGVFFYRSANPRTLEKLGRFFPVPTEELAGEIEDEGLSPEEVCARSVRALQEAGAENLYVSNLEPERAPGRLRRILEAAER